jgi:hypothetical protein
MPNWLGENAIDAVEAVALGYLNQRGADCLHKD